MDGTQLVSGSMDGTCRIWQTATKQQIRTFTGHKGSIVHVQVLVKGWNMQESEDEKRQSKPLKTLQKYASETEGLVTVNVGHHSSGQNSTWPLWQHAATSTLHPAMEPFKKEGTSSHLEGELDKLRGDVSALTEENVKWKSLNNQLYQLAFSKSIQ